MFRAQELLLEIRLEGLGEHVHKDFNNGDMKIKSFIEFIKIEQHGLALLNQLAEDFDMIVLLEHYENWYKIKLPMFESSVGFLFGVFEERYKEIYKIGEYSVNQNP